MTGTKTGRRRYSGEMAQRRLDCYLASVGQGMNAYLERRERMDEVRRLERLSDEQLLALGLRREMIPRHVFRDLLTP